MSSYREEYLTIYVATSKPSYRKFIRPLMNNKTSQNKDPLFKAVEIEINSGCNMACSYCPNSGHERTEQGHMKKKLFLTLMQQLKELQYKGRLCYHFYNEPMTSPQLIEFVEISKQYLPESRSELYTNGTLLNLNKFVELEEAGMDRFIVTKHEGTKVFPFEKTLALLSESQRKKVKFSDHTELILSNRGGLVETIGTAKPPLKLPCFVPSLTVIVTLKGNIVTCYEDYHQKTVMGNILETSIEKIWNNSRYQTLRAALKEGKRSEFDVCRDCNNRLII